MTKVAHNPGGGDEYVVNLTKTELDALRETAKDADGRKSNVKLARRVLGVN